MASSVVQRQRDLVEALEQLASLAGLELELEAQVAGADRAVLEVDDALHAGVLGGEVEQGAHVVLGQGHRQQPAAERVAAEDVGERRRDHRADAVVLERPHRVLARRAAAEVAPGHQHRAAAVRVLVEHEVRALGAAVVVAPGVEEERAEAGALDALEELLGDDLVGVDVGAVERHQRAVLAAERPHDTGLRDARRQAAHVGDAALDRGGRGHRRATPGGCARRVPGGPRSCGCWCWRSARRAGGCRGSSPGTSSSRRRATRRRRR